jgi:DNA-binding transcriptional ArsR family regulator
MATQPNFAAVAGLLGDAARAAMIDVMMDGGSHAAAALAEAADVSAQTASAHLAKLVAGGVVAVEAEGRHRRYALKSAKVAEAVEALSALAPPPTQGAPRMQVMAAARTCYDHLAGRLGVAAARSLEARGMLMRAGDRFELTPEGRAYFVEVLGVDVEAAFREKRPLARCCLDWTEREPHLAGALGAALARRSFQAGWVEPRPGGRALAVTRAGAAVFEREFGHRAT